MKTENKKQIINYRNVDFETLLGIIQEEAVLITELFRDNKYTLISDEYEDTRVLLTEIADIEVQDESKEFLLGRCVGIMEMASEILLKNKRNEPKKKCLELKIKKCELSRNKRCELKRKCLVPFVTKQ